MKTLQSPSIVSYLLGLFDTMVLLVAWPLGKKGCRGTDFTKISVTDMMDPEYCRKLAEGNIGVVQGDASGGIGSIDIDDDQGAEEFLALNPDLKETLRSRGARGCNVWFYPDGGDVPRSGRLKRNGQPWGEWRHNGCQTIIAGGFPRLHRILWPDSHACIGKGRWPLSNLRQCEQENQSNRVLTGQWYVHAAFSSPRIAAKPQRTRLILETRNFLSVRLSGEAARNSGHVWRRAWETTHSEGGFWGAAVRM